LTNFYSNLWALSSGIDAVEAADERFIMAVLIIAVRVMKSFAVQNVNDDCDVKIKIKNIKSHAYRTLRTHYSSFRHDEKTTAEKAKKSLNTVSYHIFIDAY
jgi:hypothetical protein